MAQDVKNQKSRRTFDASFKLQVVQMIKAQYSPGNFGPEPCYISAIYVRER